MKTRWVVLNAGTPWHNCVAAAIPFLADARTDYAMCIPLAEYQGPLAGERDVVMNPHVAPILAPIFRRDADRVVLYETENVLDPSSNWRRASSWLRLRCPENRWWNYSAANASMFGDEVRALRKIHHLPRRDDRTPRPIDVLFVGSLNQRRAAILAALTHRGARVHIPDGPCFGADLERLEAKSKLLLNVHYYTPGVFESFRVVPAAHRGTPVISETSASNEGTDWAPCYAYTDLVEATLAALKGMR